MKANTLVASFTMLLTLQKQDFFFLDDISCGLGESEYFPKYTVSVDVAEGSVTPKCPRSFKQIEV